MYRNSLKNTQHLTRHDSINRRVESVPTSSGLCSFPRSPSAVLSKVSWLDRWLTRKMLDTVGNPPVRILLWDGVEASPRCKNPVAEIFYADRNALLKTIVDHERYWGDLYSSGRVEVKGDMTRFLEVMYNSFQNRHKKNYLTELLRRFGNRKIINSPSRARDNIHHHYDIGNAFYQLWLDREHMQYSCAYFPHHNMTLEQAQQAKLEHICRKLQLKPGDRVVEAGCGWGGLSRFMVKHYAVSVTAYNISAEQIHYCRQHADDDDCSSRLEYVQDDYRNIRGQFDVFVSVGMLEHVAKQDYAELGKVIKRCLKPSGRGLLHSIGRITQRPMNPWIERHIFPGAYPPTLSEMMQILEPNQLAVLDVENLRLHYAQTIQTWVQRFEQHKTVISEMMDEQFIRAWSLYLYGSIAAFNVGKLQLFQLVFNHEQHNRLPRSRQFIYQKQNSENDRVEKFNA